MNKRHGSFPVYFRTSEPQNPRTSTGFGAGVFLEFDDGEAGPFGNYLITLDLKDNLSVKESDELSAMLNRYVSQIHWSE